MQDNSITFSRVRICKGGLVLQINVHDRWQLVSQLKKIFLMWMSTYDRLEAAKLHPSTRDKLQQSHNFQLTVKSLRRFCNVWIAAMLDVS